MKPVNVLAALTLGIAMWLQAQTASATRVMVFAAASLTESLREIAGEYEKGSRDRIVFNFGGSSTLARQIEEGAPADLFFSADEAQMDRLKAKDLIAEGSRTNFLSNTLVIVVGLEEGATVRNPQDLAGPAIRRIALGDPKGVPIGVYARQYLEREGLWARVAPRVVVSESVRAALAAVESGNADASIVYKTDARVSRRVKTVYEVPASEAPTIRYPAAIVTAAKNGREAEAFLRYLTSPSARAIFSRHGFVTFPAVR